MDKRTKECIEYYLKNIGTEKYIEAKNKAHIESRKNHLDYVNSEKPQWKNRTDYYEDDDVSVSQVLIVDVLSNEGVSKLVKKLYSLPKEEPVQNFL
ncbi:MAG: hypothetical protein PHI27_11410 [Eubacteriales bacterium]|nr:hypothetical protein [Eubacteriales bacterium]MDD4512126.1 hypothetical protein [Eubacteriales bacterium]